MAIARRRMLSTAYPRACGEHPCSISLFVKELLVPDQATNKSRSKSRPWASGFWFSHLRRLAEHLNEKLLGLTPAPAGNTVTRLGFCGLFSGLPPRLRGTLAVAQESCSYVRFTPAPAGNTSGRSGQIGCASVYPRACGEHVRTRVERHACVGLPPRLRGTPTLFEGVQRARRFTPAPAGNTYVETSVVQNLPVYPRACGEHPLGINTEFAANGLPPRLRGTQSDAVEDVIINRFTPAPAGNT